MKTKFLKEDLNVHGIMKKWYDKKSGTTLGRWYSQESSHQNTVNYPEISRLCWQPIGRFLEGKAEKYDCDFIVIIYIDGG